MKKIILIVLIILTIFLASYFAYVFILKDSCQFSFSTKSKNICYYNKAIKENNVETCNKIVEVICYGCDVGPARMQCYSSVALENNNPLACKKHEEIGRIDALLRCLESVDEKYPNMETCKLFPKEQVILREINGTNVKEIQLGFDRWEACYYYNIIEKKIAGTDSEQILEACKKYLSDSKKLLLDCEVAIAENVDKTFLYARNNYSICNRIPFGDISIYSPPATTYHNVYQVGPIDAFSTIGSGIWYKKYDCILHMLEFEICDKPGIKNENFIPEGVYCLNYLSDLTLKDYTNEYGTFRGFETDDDEKVIFTSDFCDKIQNISVEKCKQLYR